MATSLTLSDASLRVEDVVIEGDKWTAVFATVEFNKSCTVFFPFRLADAAFFLHLQASLKEHLPNGNSVWEVEFSQTKGHAASNVVSLPQGKRVLSIVFVKGRIGVKSKALAYCDDQLIAEIACSHPATPLHLECLRGFSGEVYSIGVVGGRTNNPKLWPQLALKLQQSHSIALPAITQPWATPGEVKRVGFTAFTAFPLSLFTASCELLGVADGDMLQRWCGEGGKGTGVSGDPPSCPLFRFEHRMDEQGVLSLTELTKAAALPGRVVVAGGLGAATANAAAISSVAATHWQGSDTRFDLLQLLCELSRVVHCCWESQGAAAHGSAAPPVAEVEEALQSMLALLTHNNATLFTAQSFNTTACISHLLRCLPANYITPRVFEAVYNTWLRLQGQAAANADDSLSALTAAKLQQRLLSDWRLWWRPGCDLQVRIAWLDGLRRALLTSKSPAAMTSNTGIGVVTLLQLLLSTNDTEISLVPSSQSEPKVPLTRQGPLMISPSAGRWSSSQWLKFFGCELPKVLAPAAKDSEAMEGTATLRFISKSVGGLLFRVVCTCDESTLRACVPAIAWAAVAAVSQQTAISRVCLTVLHALLCFRPKAALAAIAEHEGLAAAMACVESPDLGVREAAVSVVARVLLLRDRHLVHHLTSDLEVVADTAAPASSGQGGAAAPPGSGSGQQKPSSSESSGSSKRFSLGKLFKKIRSGSKTEAPSTPTSQEPLASPVPFEERVARVVARLRAGDESEAWVQLIRMPSRSHDSGQSSTAATQRRRHSKTDRTRLLAALYRSLETLESLDATTIGAFFRIAFQKPCRVAWGPGSPRYVAALPPAMAAAASSESLQLDYSLCEELMGVVGGRNEGLAAIGSVEGRRARSGSAGIDGSAHSSLVVPEAFPVVFAALEKAATPEVSLPFLQSIHQSFMSDPTQVGAAVQQTGWAMWCLPFLDPRVFEDVQHNGNEARSEASAADQDDGNGAAAVAVAAAASSILTTMLCHALTHEAAGWEAWEHFLPVARKAFSRTDITTAALLYFIQRVVRQLSQDSPPQLQPTSPTSTTALASSSPGVIHRSHYLSPAAETARTNIFRTLRLMEVLAPPAKMMEIVVEALPLLSLLHKQRPYRYEEMKLVCRIALKSLHSGLMTLRNQSLGEGMEGAESGGGGEGRSKGLSPTSSGGSQATVIAEERMADVIAFLQSLHDVDILHAYKVETESPGRPPRHSRSATQEGRDVAVKKSNSRGRSATSGATDSLGGTPPSAAGGDSWVVLQPTPPSASASEGSGRDAEISPTSPTISSPATTVALFLVSGLHECLGTCPSKSHLRDLLAATIIGFLDNSLALKPVAPFLSPVARPADAAADGSGLGSPVPKSEGSYPSVARAQIACMSLADVLHEVSSKEWKGAALEVGTKDADSAIATQKSEGKGSGSSSGGIQGVAYSLDKVDPNVPGWLGAILVASAGSAPANPIIIEARRREKSARVRAKSISLTQSPPPPSEGWGAAAEAPAEGKLKEIAEEGSGEEESDSRGGDEGKATEATTEAAAQRLSNLDEKEFWEDPLIDRFTEGKESEAEGSEEDLHGSVHEAAAADRQHEMASDESDSEGESDEGTKQAREEGEGEEAEAGGVAKDGQSTGAQESDAWTALSYRSVGDAEAHSISDWMELKERLGKAVAGGILKAAAADRLRQAQCEAAMEGVSLYVLQQLPPPAVWHTSASPSASVWWAEELKSGKHRLSASTHAMTEASTKEGVHAATSAHGFIGWKVDGHESKEGVAFRVAPALPRFPAVPSYPEFSKLAHSVEEVTGAILRKNLHALRTTGKVLASAWPVPLAKAKQFKALAQLPWHSTMPLLRVLLALAAKRAYPVPATLMTLSAEIPGTLMILPELDELPGESKEGEDQGVGSQRISVDVGGEISGGLVSLSLSSIGQWLAEAKSAAAATLDAVASYLNEMAPEPTTAQQEEGKEGAAPTKGEGSGVAAVEVQEEAMLRGEIGAAWLRGLASTLVVEAIRMAAKGHKAKEDGRPGLDDSFSTCSLGDGYGMSRSTKAAIVWLPQGVVNSLKDVFDYYKLSLPTVANRDKSESGHAFASPAMSCWWRVRQWSVTSLRAVFMRRYGVRETGMEFFTTSGILRHRRFLYVFDSPTQRNRFASALQGLPGMAPIQNPNALGPKPSAKTELASRWQERSKSSLSYLMHLNRLAGRSPNDAGRYPIIPWTNAAWYDAPSCPIWLPTSLRDLARPMGALTPARLAEALQRYSRGFDAWEAMEGAGTAMAALVKRNKMKKGRRASSVTDIMMAPFMYGSHYSSSLGTVGHFLLRTLPGGDIAAEEGHLDVPDRLFRSFADCWRLCSSNVAEVKELPHDVFSAFHPFVNTLRRFLGLLQKRSDREIVEAAGSGGGGGGGVGGVGGGGGSSASPQDFKRLVGDVEMPTWVEHPRLLPRLLRAHLEGELVSRSLHRWIDLMFGSASRGPNAIKTANVFYPLTYPENVDSNNLDANDTRALQLQAAQFGQCPEQLFTDQHSARHDHGNFVLRCSYTSLRDFAAAAAIAQTAAAKAHPEVTWVVTTHFLPLHRYDGPPPVEGKDLHEASFASIFHRARRLSLSHDVRYRGYRTKSQDASSLYEPSYGYTPVHSTSRHWSVWRPVWCHDDAALIDAVSAGELLPLCGGDILSPHDQPPPCAAIALVPPHLLQRQPSSGDNTKPSNGESLPFSLFEAFHTIAELPSSLHVSTAGTLDTPSAELLLPVPPQGYSGFGCVMVPPSSASLPTLPLPKLSQKKRCQAVALPTDADKVGFCCIPAAFHHSFAEDSGDGMEWGPVVSSSMLKPAVWPTEPAWMSPSEVEVEATPMEGKSMESEKASATAEAVAAGVKPESLWFWPQRNSLMTFRVGYTSDLAAEIEGLQGRDTWLDVLSPQPSAQPPLQSLDSRGSANPAPAGSGGASNPQGKAPQAAEGQEAEAEGVRSSFPTASSMPPIPDSLSLSPSLQGTTRSSAGDTPMQDDEPEATSSEAPAEPSPPETPEAAGDMETVEGNEDEVGEGEGEDEGERQATPSKATPPDGATAGEEAKEGGTERTQGDEAEGGKSTVTAPPPTAVAPPQPILRAESRSMTSASEVEGDGSGYCVSQCDPQLLEGSVTALPPPLRLRIDEESHAASASKAITIAVKDCPVCCLWPLAVWEPPLAGPNVQAAAVVALHAARDTDILLIDGRGRTALLGLAANVPEPPVSTFKAPPTASKPSESIFWPSLEPLLGCVYPRAEDKEELYGGWHSEVKESRGPGSGAPASTAASNPSFGRRGVERWRVVCEAQWAAVQCSNGNSAKSFATSLWTSPVAVSSSGRFVVSTTPDSHCPLTVQLLDKHARFVTHWGNLPIALGRVTSLSLHEHLFAAGTADGFVYLWRFRPSSFAADIPQLAVFPTRIIAPPAVAKAAVDTFKPSQGTHSGPNSTPAAPAVRWFTEELSAPCEAAAAIVPDGATMKETEGISSGSSDVGPLPRGGTQSVIATSLHVETNSLAVSWGFVAYLYDVARSRCIGEIALPSAPAHGDVGGRKGGGEGEGGGPSSVQWFIHQLEFLDDGHLVVVADAVTDSEAAKGPASSLLALLDASGNLLVCCGVPAGVTALSISPPSTTTRSIHAPPMAALGYRSGDVRIYSLDWLCVKPLLRFQVPSNLAAAEPSVTCLTWSAMGSALFVGFSTGAVAAFTFPSWQSLARKDYAMAQALLRGMGHTATIMYS